MEGSRTPGQAFAGTAGRWLPALLLLLALLFNGSRGLWAPDEGRYVVGAMEMLRRGDFVGIFLNDDTAHFTKPPLTYWSIAAAMAAFGQSEFAARLPNALAFVATALLLLPRRPATDTCARRPCRWSCTQPWRCHSWLPASSRPTR